MLAASETMEFPERYVISAAALGLQVGTMAPRVLIMSTALPSKRASVSFSMGLAYPSIDAFPFLTSDHPQIVVL